ncbi:MAG: GGDEF domain-containing protein [Sphaerochaetaceae bacterium]
MPEEVRRNRFNRNRIAARFIAAFFSLEQFFYGLMLSEQGSAIQKVYYITSAVSFLIFLSTFLSRFFKRTRRMFILDVIELFGIFTAFSLPIVRLFFIENVLAHVPTIYTAVIYAVAVIFLLDYWQSILSYALLMCIAALVITRFRTGPYEPIVIADLTINGILACTVSCSNYYFYKRQGLFAMEIEKRNDQLKKMTEIDQLTGLFNRRKIDELFESCRIGNCKTSILFDIDDFKQINDTYGHLTGDEILIELANLVKNNIEEKGMCIRWGGEEFLIVTAKEKQFAEVLQRRISSHPFTQGIKITASFGVAHCSDYESITDLLRTLDKNLYIAKESGKNCVIG